MTTRPRNSNRPAFTLVELMVVLTVIGILVGLLAAGIIPAWKRSNEFTIQQEMTQLERAVEDFKTKYGFYPPSFVRILHNDIDGSGMTEASESIAALLPYINRIAPNHAETQTNLATNNTYIEDWWINVGRFISYKDGSDMVFWLSGLAKNKQFPLSGSATPTQWWAFGADPLVERDQIYAFDSGQLFVKENDLGSGNFSYNSAYYLQPKGAEVPFLYIDNSSYAHGPSVLENGDPVFFDGFTNNLPAEGGTFSGNTFVPGVYENPNTFQIITFGMDGRAGAPWEPNAPTTSNFTTNWRSFVSNEAADNICGFAAGRLERMLLGTNE